MEDKKYFKVIKNREVIDALDGLRFVKYQIRNKTLLLCKEEEAEGILSSDGTSAYHTTTLRKFPVDIYPVVTIEEIDRYEYDRLITLHCKTPEQIIDDYTRELIERGLL